MNSEELELSLRTEFEEQLKNVFAEMRQEITQLQEKVEAEFEKHKTQLSEVFQDFSARIETDKPLDSGFTEAVVEHLRLARDEGARITATAIAEAEEMQQASDQAAAEAAAPTVGMSELRDAINDISSQTSQSSILKTLVSHAEKFTARGAFFILKNEHFVGWRVFGSNQEERDEKTIREIFFPVSSETVLGESVRSLSAVESSYGTYAGDSAYLDKLEFGQPEQMFAIPLVARGRGVAVLYADSGDENKTVNVEALETLVRVAGLTVEVTASSPAGSSRYEAAPAPAYSDSTASSVQTEKEADEQQAESYYQTEEASSEADASESYQPETQFADSQTAAGYSQPFDNDVAESADETNYQTPGENFSYQSDRRSEETAQNLDSDEYAVEVVDDEETDTQEFEQISEEQESQPVYGQAETASENYTWNKSLDSADSNDKTDLYQTGFEPASAEDYSAPETNDYQAEDNQYGSGQPLDSPQFQFEEADTLDNLPSQSGDTFIPQADDSTFAQNESYGSFTAETAKANDFMASPPVQTTSQPASAPPVKSRFSDRNVDLPIEVSEDERRLHNDARRFARLLVSEIKLYNEQKVKEGREARDLYERLREAIDRSREMYDKRVQPPVAAKFDYFHYELVSTLAEGEQAKLGGSYQGATV